MEDDQTSSNLFLPGCNDLMKKVVNTLHEFSSWCT